MNRLCGEIPVFLLSPLGTSLILSQRKPGPFVLMHACIVPRRHKIGHVDEILQIILNELDDPTNFSLVNKSIYAFTREPYVRATYFMMRYGKVQALYWALGRGKLVNTAVIDVSYFPRIFFLVFVLL